MDTAAILSELEAERDRLTQAIEALQGSHRASGRSKATAAGRRKRHMSAEAKRKQSLAAKRRWKAAKAAGKNRL
jgi:hypothetical protein